MERSRRGCFDGAVCGLVAVIVFCLPLSVAQGNVFDPRAELDARSALRDVYRQQMQEGYFARAAKQQNTAPTVKHAADDSYDIVSSHVDFSANQTTGTIDVTTTIIIKAFHDNFSQVDLYMTPLATISVKDGSSADLSWGNNPATSQLWCFVPTLSTGQTATIVIHNAGMPDCDLVSGEMALCRVTPEIVYFLQLNYVARKEFHGSEHERVSGPMTFDITTPPGYTAITSGMPTGIDDHGTYLVQHFTGRAFEGWPPLAFANFETYVSYTSDLDPVSVYIHDSETDFGATWAAVGAQAVDLFTDLFTPLYLPKMDLVQTIPELGGAIGIPGGVLLGQDIVMRNPAQLGSECNFGHEIGHSWWGLMIQPTSADGWMNEAFASYCCLFLSGQRWGESAVPFYRENFEQFFFQIDPDLEDPIAGSTYSTDAEYFLFYWDVYIKGSSVLRMLQWYLGDDAFFDGMSLYARQNRWVDTNTYATYAGFKTAMETAAGMDLTTFFDQWLNGTGYPIYQYAAQFNPADGGTFSIDVQIKQIQTTATVFSMPVEISVWFEGSEDPWDVRIDMQQATRDVTLYSSSKPRAITLDRSSWLWADKRPKLEGDVDGSNEVDGTDLIYVAWAQGATFVPVQTPDPYVATPYLWETDFNRDGSVNSADLTKVLDAFGRRGVIQ
jgi:hypothetical protein